MALRQEELTSLCDDVDLERDRALVERCQAGDSAAFGNLYRGTTSDYSGFACVG